MVSIVFKPFCNSDFEYTYATRRVCASPTDNFVYVILAIAYIWLESAGI